MRISVKLVNRDVDHWVWKTGQFRYRSILQGVPSKSEFGSVKQRAVC